MMPLPIGDRMLQSKQRLLTVALALAVFAEAGEPEITDVISCEVSVVNNVSAIVSGEVSVLNDSLAIFSREVSVVDVIQDAISREVAVLSCAGDVNLDGVVDPLDTGFVLSRFGCAVGEDLGCARADQNGDGVVDPLDSGAVLSRFGPCE